MHFRVLHQSINSDLGISEGINFLLRSAIGDKGESFATGDVDKTACRWPWPRRPGPSTPSAHRAWRSRGAVRAFCGEPLLLSFVMLVSTCTYEHAGMLAFLLGLNETVIISFFPPSSSSSQKKWMVKLPAAAACLFRDDWVELFLPFLYCAQAQYR